jgi:uncharacterized lipoprotein YajG
MKRIVLIIAMSLLIAGCVIEQPQVISQPGISFAHYNALGIAPASNDTGQSADFDFAETFTQDLRSALRGKGYQISDASEAPPDGLIVQCSFVNYEEGNAFTRWLAFGLGASKATVKTTLVDKKSGKAVGDIVTVKEITGGVLGGIGGYEAVLESVANDVSIAIDNKIKGA